MIAVVRGTRRRIFALATVLLFTMSFPPFSWPTWWFCLAPMVWMWRDGPLNLSRRRIVAEAIMIGFSAGWLSTGFVRAGLPAWGNLIHAAACLLFSVQFVAMAFTIRLMRHHCVPVAAAVTALTATGGELFAAC